MTGPTLVAPPGELRELPFRHPDEQTFHEGSADLFAWMRGAWIGMGCKAVFAANIEIFARKPTPQTARAK